MANSLKARRRGSSLLEFALSFPILIVMVLGVFELGKTGWSYAAVTYATRQGLRYAVVHGSNAPPSSNAVRDVVRGNAIGLEASTINVNVTYTPNNEPGSRVSVRAEYELRTIFGSYLMKAFDGGKLKVRSIATGTIMY